MANYTYLQLVNQVLQGLRETQVGSVSSTSYSMLIGKWINDAKRQVEDAWDWQCLNATIEFNLVPFINGVQSAQLNYHMDGSNGTILLSSGYDWNPDLVTFNLTDRAHIRTDVMMPDRPMAFDLTTGLPMQLIKQPADWILRTLYIQPTPLTQTQPMFFGLIKQGGSYQVQLFETPIAVRKWHFMWTVPQVDLVNDGDVMLAPWMPVVAIATDIAMAERGEEIGEPGNTVAQRAALHIDNAIAQDSREQEHKYTFYPN